MLHMPPNSKNDVMWAPWNPHEEVVYIFSLVLLYESNKKYSIVIAHNQVECKRQGDSKLMAWCGIVDGRMLTVHWIVDDAG